MSFGFSIGDIILCSQITYRLFVAATSGRRDAPRGLEELEGILFGLSCSLNHLQKSSMAVLSRSNYEADEVQDQLGLMLYSCRRTLEDLENATAKYREAGKSPVSTSNGHKRLRISSQVSQVKIQWRRFIWDLQGESLSRYRRKLQSHTDALNLLLGALIWFVLGSYLRIGP